MTGHFISWKGRRVTTPNGVPAEVVSDVGKQVIVRPSDKGEFDLEVWDKTQVKEQR